MNNRTSALAALSLVAGLLTGCGHMPATAPAATAMAPIAAREAAAPTLPDHLCIDDVSRTRSERNERITIKAHSDAKKLTLEFSSFFPYYVPMYGSVVLNGRTVKLDKAFVVPLDKLVREADVSGLSDRAQGNLHTLLYGLNFAAGHWE